MNIQYNDLQDYNSVEYHDLLLSLGLQQHISFSTHRSGNILDHVISNSCQDLITSNPEPGPRVSDHCLFQFYCSLPNRHVVLEETQYQNMKEINIEFRTSLKTKLDFFPAEECLDVLLKRFTDILTTAIEVLDNNVYRMNKNLFQVVSKF